MQWRQKTYVKAPEGEEDEDRDAALELKILSHVVGDRCGCWVSCLVRLRFAQKIVPSHEPSHRQDDRLDSVDNQVDHICQCIPPHNLCVVLLSK